MKFEIEWENNPSRSYDKKYSTVHGWVTKMRGTLFDNERVRRDGIWEMKAAKAVREYKRKRAAEKRARGEKTSSGLLSFFGLGRSRRSKNRPVGSRHGSSHGVILVRGSTTRTHNSRSSRSSRRARPHHHGHGAVMQDDAKRERDRERRRRQRQREYDAQAMRREARRATGP